jgi:predicted dienelactone hydrolase
MSPLEILAVLGAIVLVLARWSPTRARRPILLSGTAIVAITGLALAVLGLRWQLVPLFLFSTLALLTIAATVLLRRRSRRDPRRAKWWLALPGTAACLLLIAATPVAAWAMPMPVYPEPTGEYAVGAATFQWTDTDRPEPFSADPDDHRTIVVQLWYPAEESGPEVERAVGGRATVEESREVFEASAEFFGIPSFLLDDVAEVRSHAVFDAQVAEGNTRFPVIVFSPGLSATRTTNTVLAEEWAGHGYIVATVDHAYDSAITFIDGEPVHSRNTVGDTDIEMAQMNRDNLAMRTSDLSFVLTQLERLDRAEIPGTLAGRLDTDRAAVAGHSRGAAAALMVLAEERRFDAAIHIDGGLEPTMPVRPYDQPVLSITSPVSEADNPDYIPNLERVLDLGTGETGRIELAGAGHFSFTDAALYFPPLPSVLGTIGRTEGLRLTAEATTAFLDAELH